MGFNDEDGFTPNWRNAEPGFGGSQEGNGMSGDFARHEAFAKELRRFAFSGDVDSGTDSGQQARIPSDWGSDSIGVNAFTQAQLGQVKQFRTFLKAGDAQYGMVNEANDSTVQQFGQGLMPAASSPDEFTARHLNSGGASGDGAGQQPGQSAEVPVPPSPQENGCAGQDRETWEKMKGLDQETQTYLHGPRWPANGKINSPYGNRIPPKQGASSFHKGIDVSNPVGGDVVASESGEVINISPYGSGGNTVQIRNRDGSVSYYSHTKPSVRFGQKVYAGDVVGNTDLTGITSGGHVHYELHDSNDKHFDPATRLPRR
ncbi:MAG: peptidase [Desulfovibrionaceae bacterium]|nr:MAG: peptidase [Desulfovibrionaceae bacterium]